MSVNKLNILSGTLEVNGSPTDKEIWNYVCGALRSSNAVGEVGYKIPALGVVKPDEIPSIIVMTATRGVSIIEIVDRKVLGVTNEGLWLTDAGCIQSKGLTLDFYLDEVKKRFKRYSELYNRKTREFDVDIRPAIVFRDNTSEEITAISDLDVKDIHVITMENIHKNVSEFVSPIESEVGADESKLSKMVGCLDGTDCYESENLISSVQEPKTVDDFIRLSLHKVFRQDDQQRQISMQIPNGPQRVRGLAGTGKTIVLSLKAAITHFNFPDFRVLFLFNTQSLYNQINGLIEKYYIPEAKRAPNWDVLNVRHAWGAKDKPGLYSDLCDRYGIRRLTFNDVRGYEDGLKVIYSDLLSRIGDKIEPIYDLVLIDEAQDFPEEVFQIAYKICKDPKRVVWAYDEFQTLRDIHIKPPEELFGQNEIGEPNIKGSDLEGCYEGEIKKDYMLQNSYRNPRIVLMIAHGVALGLYSESGIVDTIDRKQDWQALGYDVAKPDKEVFQAGDIIQVGRPDIFSRNDLENLLSAKGKAPKKLVNTKRFSSNEEQIIAVADDVKRLIDSQGVAPEEIFVITLNTKKSKDILADIRAELNVRGVKAIMPGIIEKSSAFKEDGCITLATPFRAKGNEARIVFVINSERVIDDYGFRGRNSFFVSVTRSQGWCHIFGVGSSMDKLIHEIERIKEDYPNFSYERPSDSLVERRRNILSRTDEELGRVDNIIDRLIDDEGNLSYLLEKLKGKGVIDKE